MEKVDFGGKKVKRDISYAERTTGFTLERYLIRGNFGAHLLTSDPALLSLLEAVDDVLNCVLHLIAGELEDVHVEPMYVIVVGE